MKQIKIIQIILFQILSQNSMNSKLGSSKLALSTINSQLNSSSANKFNAYKIKSNYFDNDKLNDQNYDYEFEENKKNKIINIPYSRQEKNEGKQICKQQLIVKQNQTQVKCLLDELSYPNKSNSKNISQQQEKHKMKIKQQELDDDIWNMIQQQLNNDEQQINKNKEQKYLPSVAKQQQKTDLEMKNQKNCENSQCQFTKQQLQAMILICQEPTSNEIQNEKSIQNNLARHQQRSSCVYFSDQQGVESNNSQDSWGEINSELNKQDYQSEYQMPHNSQIPLANIQHKSQNQTDTFGFVIIDGAPIPNNINSQQEYCRQQAAKSSERYEKTCKYGPWKFNNQLYNAHENYKLETVQHLMLSKKEAHGKTQEQLIYQSEKPLRKINWEVMEEKKSQVKSLKSKRHCKTALIEHGKDFLIYDHFKFMQNPIREGVHIYLGVRSFGDFSQCNQSEYGSKKQLQTEQFIKDYLYFSSSGQCLLQTDYHLNQCAIFPNNVDKFDILLSLTKQKVAVCERFVSNGEKDKRQCIQIKSYDRFQNCQAQYIGLIESKISKFNEQWYCDTSIYIPKKKIYSNKSNQKNWQRLKMQLRVSEMGTIVAQLGIFDAKSSVTNCILFNENKTSQFMMGTIQQNQEQINYVVRIQGISPILAFAAVISRKLFVFSA